MKTKTLLLTAALGVAGAATTIAQVYSVNAVGYVNTELTAGKFNMISNPLDAGAGNNTIPALFASLPEGSIVYKYTNGGYEDPNVFDLGEWSDPNQTLVPGEGAFVIVSGTENVTVTFVGEVPQGLEPNCPTTSLPAGFSMVSSKVPQSGLVATDLGYPAEDGDIIYTWDAAAGYTIYTYECFGVDCEWTPEEPTIDVGEAFWSLKSAPAEWVRCFSVND